MSDLIYDMHKKKHPHGWIKQGMCNCKRSKDVDQPNDVQKMSLSIDYIYTNQMFGHCYSDTVIYSNNVYYVLSFVMSDWLEQSFVQYTKPRLNEFIEYKLSYIMNTISEHLGFSENVISTAINITLCLSFMTNNDMIDDIKTHHNIYSRCLDIDISFLEKDDRMILCSYFGSKRLIYVRFLLLISMYLNKHYDDSIDYKFYSKVKSITSTEKLVKILDNPILGHIILILVNTLEPKI